MLVSKQKDQRSTEDAEDLGSFARHAVCFGAGIEKLNETTPRFV